MLAKPSKPKTTFILTLLSQNHSRSRLLSFSKCVLWFSLTFIGLGPLFAANPQLRIVVFNVGQTDSQLIVGPTGRTLLIDVGAEVIGKKKQYEYVAERIREITGKTHIDYLVVSHFHYDHVGNIYPGSPKGNGIWGLFAAGIDLDTLVDRGDVSPYGKNTASHQNYIQSIDAWKRTGKIKKRAGAHLGHDQVNLGPDVKVEIVAVNGNKVLTEVNAQDADRFKKAPPSENDYSIALKISIGKFEYFTGGDLTGLSVIRSFGEDSQTSYNDVESSIATVVGDVEILHVNHHGSEYSSNQTFIDRLRPEFSIISCGSNNSYGHPSPQIIKRLKSYGEVMVTKDITPERGTNIDAGEVVFPGDDVEVRVEANGESYSIAGKNISALSDEEEAKQREISTPKLQDTVPKRIRIRWDEAPEFVGRYVTVVGTVRRVRELNNVTYLRFSRTFWKDLNAVVVGSARKKLESEFLKSLEGKRVEIDGKIVEYDGNPEILLEGKEFLRILSP